LLDPRDIAPKARRDFRPKFPCRATATFDEFKSGRGKRGGGERGGGLGIAVTLTLTLTHGASKFRDL
jgi:hypothetical protein